MVNGMLILYKIIFWCNIKDKALVYDAVNQGVTLSICQTLRLIGTDTKFVV